ncbi:MAG: hypothetical protein FWD51_02080 [Betaproteobacteria bacterium]|nr:hypothetical protein [Betaproteobacteria bacterium]
MLTRTSRLLLGLVISFSFCAVSFAQNPKEKVHYFSIAPEVSRYEYKEPGIMKLSGTMVGFSAEYLNSGGVGRIGKSVPIQLRARVNHMYGELDYDGGLQDMHGNYMGPYKSSRNRNQFIDMIFAGGLEFKLTEGFSVSPYLGVGYRYLVDKADGEYYGFIYVRGHKREQTYYYIPVGLNWKISPAPSWRLTLNNEFDYLVRGENTTTTYHPTEEISFRQTSGYGFRSAVKVERDLRSVGLFAEPFFRYWNIKESNVVNGWVEPKNRTQEYGLRIGVSF